MELQKKTLAVLQSIDARLLGQQPDQAATPAKPPAPTNQCTPGRTARAYLAGFKEQDLDSYVIGGSAILGSFQGENFSWVKREVDYLEEVAADGKTFVVWPKLNKNV